MKTFEEYLKEIHSKHYMGTDDNMSDDFDKWLTDLDSSELIDYADEFKDLAEQSLVGRVREAILEKKIGDEINTCYCSGYGEHKHCERSADRKIDQILSLPILSKTTPDGDNQ